MQWMHPPNSLIARGFPDFSRRSNWGCGYQLKNNTFEVMLHASNWLTSHFMVNSLTTLNHYWPHSLLIINYFHPLSTMFDHYQLTINHPYHYHPLSTVFNHCEPSFVPPFRVDERRIWAILSQTQWSPCQRILMTHRGPGMACYGAGGEQFGVPSATPLKEERCRCQEWPRCPNGSKRWLVNGHSWLMATPD